jgi:hypothetical protein
MRRKSLVERIYQSFPFGLEVNHHYRSDRGDTKVHHDRARERKEGVDLLVAVGRWVGRRNEQRDRVFYSSANGSSTSSAPTLAPVLLENALCRRNANANPSLLYSASSISTSITTTTTLSQSPSSHPTNP